MSRYSRSQPKQPRRAATVAGTAIGMAVTRYQPTAPSGNVILDEVAEVAMERGLDAGHLQDSLDALIMDKDALYHAAESINYDMQLLDYMRDDYIAMMQGTLRYGWEQGGVSYDWSARKDRTFQSRYALAKNAFAKHSVRLLTSFTLGLGISYRITNPDKEKPQPGMIASGQYQDPTETDANDYLQEFWDDEDARDVLSTARSQRERMTDLLTDGNIYLAFFVKDGKVTVTDIPDSEIADIITDPDNRRKVRAYVRRYFPRVYEEQSKRYVTGVEEKVQFYADIRSFDVPDNSLNPLPLEPDVYISHFRINATGKFGLSELFPALEWLRRHNDFMLDRAAIVRSLAEITTVVTINSPTPTSANADLVQSRNQGTLPSTASGRILQPPPAAAGKLVKGPGVEYQQLHTDTGAAQATHDNKLILIIIGCVFGFSPHYYGDGMDANRATTQSMELPVLKMIQGWQAFIADMYTTVINFVLTVGGYEDMNIDVDFPPLVETAILDRINAIVTASAQFPTSDAAKKQVVTMLLTGLGQNNVNEDVDAMFDEQEDTSNQPPPMPDMTAMQPMLPQGGQPSISNIDQRSPDVSSRAPRNMQNSMANEAAIRGTPEWPKPANQLERTLRKEMRTYFNQVAALTGDSITTDVRHRAEEILFLLMLGEYTRSYRLLGRNVATSITPNHAFDTTDFDIAAHARNQAKLINDSTWRQVEARDAGQSPSDAIKEMARTRDRADNIALNETTILLAIASLSAYEQVGAGMVEWRTAGDDRVDGACQANSGQQYTLVDARGQIPLHQGCRCMWISVK